MVFQKFQNKLNDTRDFTWANSNLFHQKTEILRSIHQESLYIVFDFTGIEFIDSASFGMLLELKNEINNSGRKFYIANTSIQVNELIQLVQLENVLEVFSFDTIKPDMAA